MSAWFFRRRAKVRRMTRGRRIDARVELEFLRATEAAAINSGRLVGRGDKNAVDQAAVDAMRTVLGEVDIDGVVVIGEGEKDEAPMLYIGEHIGTGDGPKMDVAVDPIDGTTLASKGGHGAIAVVAAAERGSLSHTHIAYMDKIIVGKAGRGVISIEASVAENVRAVAKAMERPVTEITVALLERPRNDEKVRELREIGARGAQPHRHADGYRRCDGGRGHRVRDKVPRRRHASALVAARGRRRGRQRGGHRSESGAAARRSLQVRSRDARSNRRHGW